MPGSFFGFFSQLSWLPKIEATAGATVSALIGYTLFTNGFVQDFYQLFSTPTQTSPAAVLNGVTATFKGSLKPKTGTVKIDPTGNITIQGNLKDWKLQ